MSGRSADVARTSPAGLAVEDTMFRALAVLRVLVLLNAIGFYIDGSSDYQRPAVGWTVLAAMAVWTGFAVWAYARPARRRWPLLVTDLGVTIAALALTGYVKGDPWHATLPGFWVMGVVLAAAVHWRMLGGLVAAVVLSVTDFVSRDEFTQSSYGNVFLLLVGGPVVGFLSGLLQRLATERDLALQASAAADERQRLARVVHDGVLQVLALVQRRGAEIGGEAAELGRMAGEQEVALRALVHADVKTPQHTGEVDLSTELVRLGSRQVSVVPPAEPTPIDSGRGAEVVAVVAACLSNVRHHVGRDAPAWILLEDLADRYVVSVRDDGPGIASGRVESAASEGRLGISQSILGRVHDLGGRAELHTAPGAGTEWEFTIPKHLPGGTS